MDVRVGLWRRLSAEELMLLNCGVGEDSWDQVPWTARRSNQSILKEILNIHWKDWCWSWSSNSLATLCKYMIHSTSDLQMIETEGLKFLPGHLWKTGSCSVTYIKQLVWSCMAVKVGLWRRLSAEELMLLNCGVREDSWESLDGWMASLTQWT